MRRPSDLRRELGPGRDGLGSTDREDRPAAWGRDFCTSLEDRAALLVLLCLSTMTPRRLMALAMAEGSASSCLEAVRQGRDASARDQELARCLDPADIASRLEQAGARLVTVHDPGYPAQLLDLFDPPAGLLVRGRSIDPPRPHVAIVGARNCSAAGSETASALAGALVHAGVTVVSGGARGIDAAGHWGALDADGTTVAVLGSGIDVDYPRRNRALFEEIAATGALLSEYPPGIPAEPFRFPARNRLVAALSIGVVVVEGAAGSGSMITADLALELGREVFAVPGPITSELAEVPLALIREGATLIRGPHDLLDDLGLAGPATQDPPGRAGGDAATPPSSLPGGSSELESAIWGVLQGPTAPDLIADRSGVPLPQVMSALLQLEMRGLVRTVGGRYERRLGRQGG